MAQQIVVEVMQGGQVAHTHPVVGRPLTIGRAPANDIVIPDETVSWHHAMLWDENGRAWVRDMGSRNGTFVNGERVGGAQPLGDGDLVRLGPEVTLRVRAPAATPGEWGRALSLEDLDSGLRFPLHRDRFLIGGAPSCDLHIEGALPRLATLMVHPDGEVWLGRDDVTEGDADDVIIELYEPFEVGGRRLRVRPSIDSHAPTMDAEPARYPYKLVATLDGVTGPEAVLEDLVTGRKHKVEAGNRAVLLFILGRQVERDVAESVSHEERGWCTDHDVSIGVWGAAQGASDGNSLHVLVYRLRRELSNAGFDPWFIEKRRRFIRARITEVEIH